MEKLERRSFLALIAMAACAPVAALATTSKNTTPTASWFKRLVTLEEFCKYPLADFEGKIYEFPTYIEQEEALSRESKYFSAAVKVQYPDGSWHEHARSHMYHGHSYWIDGVPMVDVDRPGDVVFLRDEDDEFRRLKDFKLAKIEFKAGRGLTTSIFHVDESPFQFNQYVLPPGELLSHHLLSSKHLV